MYLSAKPKFATLPGVCALLIALCIMTSPPALLAQTSATASTTTTTAQTISQTITKGRAIFLDERKGNCAACHKAPNDAAIKTKSTIGMALEAVKARYPDRAKLRDAIWDLSKTVPNTIMPPYGKNRILSDDEIDALVTYLETI
jgi:L-cysteine S-thiosulfotransferase